MLEAPVLATQTRPPLLLTQTIAEASSSRPKQTRCGENTSFSHRWEPLHTSTSPTCTVSAQWKSFTTWRCLSTRAISTNKHFVSLKKFHTPSERSPTFGTTWASRYCTSTSKRCRAWQTNKTQAAGQPLQATPLTDPQPRATSTSTASPFNLIDQRIMQRSNGSKWLRKATG